MRVVTNLERRARLATRHCFAEPVGTPVEAATTMVGLHSSDPATVFLSVWARAHGVTPADIEDALYSEKAIVRILGMRRTMWVVPSNLASIVNASSTVALQDRERRKTAEMIESVGVGDGVRAAVTEVSKRTGY